MAFRMPHAESVVLRMLEQAATAGLACPDNRTLANAIGANSISTAARVVNTLEDAGLIDVERTSNTRVVTIVATGERTGAPLTPLPGRARADELAELMSQDITLAAAARAMGLSEQRVSAIWLWIRQQLGPQAC